MLRVCSPFNSIHRSKLFVSLYQSIVECTLFQDAEVDIFIWRKAYKGRRRDSVIRLGKGTGFDGRAVKRSASTIHSIHFRNKSNNDTTIFAGPPLQSITSSDKGLYVMLGYLPLAIPSPIFQTLLVCLGGYFHLI